jgi:hypothetical protein
VWSRSWTSLSASYHPDEIRGIEVSEERTGNMEFVLWVIAVILVIAGIVSLVRGAVLAGIVLIVVGLLVGPGGVSVFT